MLFIVAALVWPILHLLGGSYEPEILFIPVVIGAPSFIVCHVLAMISISNRPPQTSKGFLALKALWLAVGVAILLLLVAMAFDVAMRHFKNRGTNQSDVSNGQIGIWCIMDLTPSIT